MRSHFLRLRIVRFGVVGGPPVVVTAGGLLLLQPMGLLGEWVVAVAGLLKCPADVGDGDVDVGSSAAGELVAGERGGEGVAAGAVLDAGDGGVPEPMCADAKGDEPVEFAAETGPE
jgi:hypothetical protein